MRLDLAQGTGNGCRRSRLGIHRVAPLLLVGCAALIGAAPAAAQIGSIVGTPPAAAQLPGFQQGRPTLIVLIHGKTGAPSKVPYQRIGTPDHPFYYWGYEFVRGLAGSSGTLYSWSTGSTGYQVTEIGAADWRSSTFGFALTTSDLLELVALAADDWQALLAGEADVSSILRSSALIFSRDRPTPRAPSGAGDPLTVPPLSLMFTYRDGSRTLAEQAKHVVDQIHERYTEFFFHASPQIVLVGHSMGGLVGRYILTNPVGPVAGPAFRDEDRRRADLIRDRTVALITLATPHEGSPTADLSAAIERAVLSHPLVGTGPAAMSFLNEHIDADLPATKHLETGFWRGMNQGPLAPSRAQRTDGTLIPIYALTGRTPSGGFFDNPDDGWGFGTDYGLSFLPFKDRYDRELERIARVYGARIARDTRSLIFADYFLLHLSQGYGPAEQGSSLDRARRARARPPGTVTTINSQNASAFPEPFYLYLKQEGDGQIDSDGVVGLGSGLGLNLGRSLGYFDNNREWTADGKRARGSWYRLYQGPHGVAPPRYPWEWTNHATIIHNAATGQWILQNIIRRAGPYVAAGQVSGWSSETPAATHWPAWTATVVMDLSGVCLTCVTPPMVSVEDATPAGAGDPDVTDFVQFSIEYMAAAAHAMASGGSLVPTDLLSDLPSSLAIPAVMGKAAPIRKVSSVVLHVHGSDDGPPLDLRFLTVMYEGKTRAISGTAGYGGPTEEHATATRFAAVRSGGDGSEPILRGRADNFFIILNLEHTPGFEAGDEFMLVAFAPHPVVLRKLQIKLPQSVPSTGLLRLFPD